MCNASSATYSHSLVLRSRVRSWRISLRHSGFEGDEILSVFALFAYHALPPHSIPHLPIMAYVLIFSTWDHRNQSEGEVSPWCCGILESESWSSPAWTVGINDRTFCWWYRERLKAVWYGMLAKLWFNLRRQCQDCQRLSLTLIDGVVPSHYAGVGGQ